MLHLDILALFFGRIAGLVAKDAYHLCPKGFREVTASDVFEDLNPG
jgi:hypothetical protein